MSYNYSLSTPYTWTGQLQETPSYIAKEKKKFVKRANYILDTLSTEYSP